VLAVLAGELYSLFCLGFIDSNMSVLNLSTGMEPVVWKVFLR